MASIWDSSGSKVIKTQTTIDPGLLKAAEQAKNNTSGSTTTAGTTTEMGAARLADKNGGKPSDYLGLTAAQLANKLGGKPSDYKLYVPADTYIPPAPAVTSPSGTSAALDPGLVKAAEEQAKKASSPPPGQTDITVSEAKTPKTEGANPPTTSDKATDLDSTKPVSEIKVAPEGMSTTAALSLGMMPAETAKDLGIEGTTISKSELNKINNIGIIDSVDKASLPPVREGSQIDNTIQDIKTDKSYSYGVIYDASKDDRKATAPDMSKVTDSLPMRGDVFSGGIVTEVDTKTGRITVSGDDRITQWGTGQEWYVLVDGKWERTGPTGLLYGDVLGLGAGKASPDLDYDTWQAANKTLNKYPDVLSAVADGVDSQTLKNAGYSGTMANALVDLKDYIKDGNIDIEAALADGVSTKTLGQVGVSVTDINAAKSYEAALPEYLKDLTAIVGYDVTKDNMDSAAKDADEIIKAQESLSPYLKTYEVPFITVGDYKGMAVTDGLAAAKLADKYGGKPSDYMATMKPGEQYVDVQQAVKDGIDQSILKKGIGLSIHDYTNIKNLSEYVDEKGSVNIVQAVKDGWSKNIIQSTFGLSDKEFSEAKFVADFEKANFLDKTTMAFKKDPGEFMKNVGISMIPIYGTAKLWDDNAALNTLGVVTDIAMVIPFVGGISAGVKAGMGIGRALAKETFFTARGLVVAPITSIAHPVATAKAMISPIGTLLKPSKMPTATFWRGSYATMDIPKVEAGYGPAAVATRNAMEEAVVARSQGNVSGKVPIVVDGSEIGVIKYSGSGYQTVFKNSVGTATPFGDAFTGGKGVQATGEGMYFSPDMNLGLTAQSASGKTPGYIMKNGEIVGTIGKDGVMLDAKGQTTVGRIADNSKVLGVDGGKLGKITFVDGTPTLKSGNEMIKVAITDGGGIVTDNLKIIGKYYKDQPVWEKGKLVGKINKDGMIVDSKGNIVKASKEQAVGFLPEGTEIVGSGGNVIGKVKGKPAFAIVQSKGMERLPNALQSSDNMAEYADKAWALMKADKSQNELYPVFKQYAKYIEDEALAPAGSRMVPVLDDKGKPVILKTTGTGGETIQVPLFQVVSKDWFERSLAVTRELKGKAATMQPKMTVEKMLSKVTDLPNAKETAPKIAEWFRTNKDARLVGSTVEYLYLKKNVPHDIDMGVRNPEKAAKELARIINNTGKTDIDVKVALNKDGTARLEYVDPKSGLKIEIANIKRIGQYKTTEVDGVRIEKLESQIDRTLSRMVDEFGGKGYERFNRLASSMGSKADIGIGAKAPSLADLYKLKARGVANTVRDIFKKGLTKEERLAAIKRTAPDLYDEAAAVMKMEQRRLATARKAVKRPVNLRSATVSGRTTREVSVSAQRRVERDLNRIDRELNSRRSRLEREITRRRSGLERVVRELPIKIPRTRVERDSTAREVERLLGVRSKNRPIEVTRNNVRYSSTERGRRTPPDRGRTPPPGDTPRYRYRLTKTTSRRTSRKNDDKKEQREVLEQGDVAWRQGLWWIVRRKSGETIYTKYPPEGAKRLDGTPKETFFTRGGKPQQEDKLPMGVTKVQIDLSDKPRIKFAQNKIPRNVRRQIGM
ncbi:MAG: hypothetical protein ACRKGH_09685 [Dehalogenimonas sp.]